jgi:hypothetical protein
VGINSSRGKGTVRLREEGAGVIGSARDIFAEWGLQERNSSVSAGKEELLRNRMASKTGSRLASSLARSLKIEI